jgi:hypothetical protein
VNLVLSIELLLYLLFSLCCCIAIVPFVDFYPLEEVSATAVNNITHYLSPLPLILAIC